MKLIRISPGYYLAKTRINGVERSIEIERVKAQYIGEGWVWKLNGKVSQPFTNLEKVKQDIKQNYAQH